MPNNRTTGESLSLDAEDWEIVFDAYEEFPELAFILAQHLNHLKTLIQVGREGRKQALTAVGLAVESLQPHTRFRNVGQKDYLLAVEGREAD